MELQHLFNGSALNAVDAKGRLSLPAFVRTIVERRSPEKAIILGKHETDPCLVGYDTSYNVNLLEEVRRRRLREEEQGVDLKVHHSRSRRTFGFTEPAGYDSSGRIILPPMMRKVGQIEDLVLFIGAGETFELWNPRLALASDDPELRAWAEYRLEERGVQL
ncbi:MAG TPA: division/cell wall cluster transcriptional repressor MraZ [Allosphingosinicella sp.]